jgi:F-type H+-transporting ATPase subunit b
MDIQLNMILFQMINFGIVLFALWVLLYRPVLKIFAERAKRIEEGQRAAARAIKEQEGIEELKAATEREVKEQTAAALKAATQEAKQRQQEMIAEGKAMAEAEIAKLRKQWQDEKESQITKLNQQLVDAVFSVSNRVLPKALDKKQHAELIDDELAALVKQL